jgi:hypothetical protein
MEVFEKLATSDVATMLYNTLKFYDDTDTVYMQLNLRLDIINEWHNKRDDIVRELDDAHTTTANEYQSLIMTV